MGSSSSSTSSSAHEQRGERDPAALAAGERADARVEAADAGSVDRRAARPARPGRAASAAHTWSATSPTTACRTSSAGSSSSSWASMPTVTPPAVRHPSGVGRLPAREHPQQRGLAVAVAPHDPDPVAVVEAEADAVQQGAGREGDPDALGVEQVRHYSPRPACAPSTTRAPGTGPCARRTSRRPRWRPARRTGRARARRRARGTRRSAPTPRRRFRARRTPRPPRGCARGRAERHGRRLQVVRQARADRLGVAAAQRLHQGARARAARAAPGRPGAGRARGRPPASTARSREGDHPVVVAAGQRRRQLRAPAGAHRRPADERERHVRSRGRPRSRAAPPG